jgi:hypothetical protein
VASALPRSKVVSRPLKPVTLVRFQLGEPTSRGGRGVLECTPRCERGGAGSIPVGHPASNNWVWVNGWPPGPEPGPRRFDSCRPDSRVLPNGRQPVPKTGVVVMSPRGSIPPLSSSVFALLSALSANGRRPGPQPGNGGFDSPQRHARPLRLERIRLPAFHPGDAGSNPAAVATPTAIGCGQRYERRLWRFESSRGHEPFRRRRAGAVTGRFAKPRPTTVARVRFAPSPRHGQVAKWEGAGLQPRYESVRFRPWPRRA